MGNKDLEKQLEGLFSGQEDLSLPPDCGPRRAEEQPTTSPGTKSGGGWVADEATGTPRPQSSTMRALLQPLDASSQRVEKLELGQCLRIVRKWWWLIVVSTLVAFAVGFGGSTGHLAATYKEWLTKRPVIEAAAQTLGLDPRQTEKQVRVVPKTTLIEWTAEASDPHLAPNPGDEPPNVDTLTEIQKASASPTISFTSQSGDLGMGQVNAFTSTEEQLTLLEERANAAQFVKQTVPAEMVTGQSYDVMITMKNSGSSTWNPEGTLSYILGSQNPPNNKTWGDNGAVLPGEVAPGQEVDIAFSVEAPAQPGSYDFQWQMIHNNLEWFGDKTENMAVQVVAPTPTDTLTPTDTPMPTDTPTPTNTPTPTDTPTPTPTHTPMPTHTPLSIPFPNPTMTPVPTATPTPDPAKIPPEWKGCIVFISDRDGGWPAYYIMDADGKNVEKLTGDYFYRAAAIRDTLSPDNQYQLIVATYNGDTQINLLRLSDGVQKYLVGGEKGADYDPAYCQAEPRYFAWTSSQFGDVQYRRLEIVVGDLLDSGPPQMRTTQMTRDTNRWEWDRHPSWSPDCKQIVFYSNRTGKNQIWIMDFWGMHFDGANQHPISDGNYNDWDPVWVK
jgi:hypothetical protein